jgi:hypothetical protein
MAQGTFNFQDRHLKVDVKALCGALVEEQPNGDVGFVHSTVKKSDLETLAFCPSLTLTSQVFAGTWYSGCYQGTRLLHRAMLDLSQHACVLLQSFS